MKSNQYGLGIDNVTEFEVATPTGKLVVANNKKKRDLFEALKGGGNNFGIVTRFTLKTHLARKTYGATISYKDSEAKQVKVAILNFIKREQDETLSMVAAFRHIQQRDGKVKYTIDVTCFWNGRKTKKTAVTNKALFTGFKKIKGGGDNKLWKSRPLGWGRAEDGVVLSPGKTLPRLEAQRGRFGCIMVYSINKAIIDEVEKQAKRCAKGMKKNGGIMVMIDVWPFRQGIFQKGTRSAWPPRLDPNKKIKSFFPLLAYFQWESPSFDKFWLDKMKSALESIRKVALKTKASVRGIPTYSNTSLETVTAKEVYGKALPWLSEVKRKYDPKNVMGLTGGVKIPVSKGTAQTKKARK
ncbi:hypothetical protein H0H81_009795 [Sphagnurus paluster]|uniref:Uncharacterized protein n=1 Tax=Sphagnurus paluster TaxID=117069 RepID=A0A9P7FUH0_9AGAR|nr:hypothetical protein H0H81_009795 [Sphagnurus paluster]